MSKVIIPNTSWMNGGKGITNFGPSFKPVYELAILRYKTLIDKDSSLYIGDPMYWMDGKTVTSTDLCLCREYGMGDLSEFWRIFKECKDYLGIKYSWERYNNS